MRKTLALFLFVAQFFYMGVSEPKQLHQTPLKYVKYEDLSRKAKKEIDCLARNIYYEAASEPHAGWLAVAFVTMNRVNHEAYPGSVCEVVYQKVGGTQQFSWVNAKKKMYKINESVYNEIVKTASLVYFNYGKMRDVTNGALFYHATYVKPNWKNLQRTTRIGQHIFYKTV